MPSIRANVGSFKLEDQRTLSDYNIQKNSTVLCNHLNAGPGGGRNKKGGKVMTSVQLDVNGGLKAMQGNSSND